jgi:isocitrate dehydrogenase (NAD+)
MMMKYIGESAAAERIYAALLRVFTKRKVFTRDLGGSATTTEFTEAILKEIEAR